MEKEWRDIPAVTEPNSERAAQTAREFSPCTGAYQKPSVVSVVSFPSVRAIYKLPIILGNSPNDSH